MTMSPSVFAQSRVTWTPVDPVHSRMESFRRVVNHKHGLQLKNYHDLYDYSVSDYTFWKDLWDYEGIIYSEPPTEVIAEGRMKEIPTWFPGAKMNYTENILCHDGDSIACTATREGRDTTHYTFRQLRLMVRDMAAAMRVHGIHVGDRVAAIVTNHIHAVVIGLASASIGAIFSSTATDMGIQGLLDRYTQIKPKLVFAETEVVYAGTTVNLIPKVSQLSKVLVGRGTGNFVLLPSTKTGRDADTTAVDSSLTLSSFLTSGDKRPLTYEQLPFGHPLIILYTSGTSGPPKCIVHSAGGVLMQGKRDVLLTFEESVGDTHFQFTTTGWVMWISMINTLSSGARLILYDGSPFHPSPEAFLQFVNDERVTYLGTSPRFIAEIKGKGIVPKNIAPFESLRSVMIAGAVLTPPMHEWAQTMFGSRTQVVTGLGATDTACGLMNAIPSLPIYAGEFQARSLGMKIEIFDVDGNSIEDSGEAGELVCTRPHPSLPLAFWGDESGERLRNAYFSTYPGVYHQGDFVIKNPVTKGFMILGRSDGTLNPSGVRMGTSEIYSVMEKFSNVVEDSVCVGQRRPQDQDERILLFLKMKPGVPLDNALVLEIKEAIRVARSSRHVPQFVFQVEDIPYTVNGKKIEIAVKQIVSGSTIKPSGTVINPKALELYYKYRDLEPVTRSCKQSHIGAKL
ncbi:acetoacetate-CoA ligase [Cristinia sonorae]|uniref:Acetoacetate-CoA ligase n=1 Tax=Cristinia sonorae TaxID=1940300 RepID=A0A8K0XQ61_9AGAR|nr:acetoacetate-CoA ligase [Cristinia sonorae]